MLTGNKRTTRKYPIRKQRRDSEVKNSLKQNKEETIF
jgi:hypothetical protein